MNTKNRSSLTQLDQKLPLEEKLRYGHHAYLPYSSGFDRNIVDIFNQMYSDEHHSNESYSNFFISHENIDEFAENIPYLITHSRDETTRKYEDHLPHHKRNFSQLVFKGYSPDFITEKDITDTETYTRTRRAKMKSALVKSLKILKKRNYEYFDLIVCYYSILGKKQTAYQGLATLKGISRPTARKKITAAMNELTEIVLSIYKE